MIRVVYDEKGIVPPRVLGEPKFRPIWIGGRYRPASKLCSLSQSRLPILLVFPLHLHSPATIQPPLTYKKTFRLACAPELLWSFFLTEASLLLHTRYLSIMVTKFLIIVACSLATSVWSRSIETSLPLNISSSKLINSSGIDNETAYAGDTSAFLGPVPMVAGINVDMPYADDAMWRKYVETKGNRLLCLMRATDRGAGFLTEDQRTPPSAASRWLGDFQSKYRYFAVVPCDNNNFQML